MRLPNQSPPVRRNSAPAAFVGGVKASLKSCSACMRLQWPGGGLSPICFKDCCSYVRRGQTWEVQCFTESCECQLTPAFGGSLGSLFF